MKRIRRRPVDSVERLEDRWAMTVEPFAIQGIAFSSPQVTPVVSQQENIQASAFVDFNQDGRSDLVYSVYDSKNLYIRLAQPNGAYAPAQTFAITSTATYLAAGDLNQDGLPDLVAGSDSQSVSLLSQRNPAGQWQGLTQAQAQSGLVTGLALGDVDGNGQLDLIIGRQDRVEVRLGQGNGQFSAATRYTTERGDRRVALADLDGDQDLDLVIGTSLSDGANGQVTVLRNDGEGVFENEAAKFGIGHAPMAIRLADLDSNGKLDLIVGHAVQEDGNLSVWNGLGNSTFELTPRRHEILGAPEVIELADLNQDGRLDLVIGHRGTFHHPINGNGPGGVSVVLSQPTGFNEAIRLTTPDVRALQIRDMDGNGSLDIVTMDYQSLTVHASRAAQGFSLEATHFHSSSRANSLLATGDLNADGQLDLVYVQKDYVPESIGELQVFFGSPDGQWLPGPTRPIEFYPTELYVGNLDADGNAEIVLAQTRDFSSYELATMELGPDGQLTKPAITSFGAHWQTHFVADIDQDGRLDILGFDTANNTSRVLFSRGDGTFRRGPALPNSSGWSFPKTAFIDADAYPDLLYSNDQGSYVLLGNGDGTFRQTHQSSRTYADMQLGDFDGDGHLDFADTQFDSTFIRISYGDGTGKFVRTQNIQTGRQYFVLTALDVQGDGLTDLVIDQGVGFLLARNSSTGFAPFEAHGLPFYAGQIRSVDLDGDGLRDLIASPGLSFNATQSQFTVFPGLADGRLGESITYSFPSFSLSPVQLVDPDGDERPDLVIPTFNGFLVVSNLGSTSQGDFDGDGQITPSDIDLLCAAVVAGSSESRFDLNQDATVTSSDVDYFLASIAKTTPGDVNLDGVFNSADLVALFQIGEYEDSIAGNSAWSEGDFDCSGDFTTTDLIRAFQAGRYSSN